MKKNNMGKLLGVALVVAIMCTGLFYMMFAMKANSETGTQMVVAAKALKAGTVLRAEISRPLTGRLRSFRPAPIATRRKLSEIPYSALWRPKNQS